jgi:hypothetical protein
MLWNNTVYKIPAFGRASGHNSIRRIHEWMRNNEWMKEKCQVFALESCGLCMASVSLHGRQISVCVPGTQYCYCGADLVISIAKYYQMGTRCGTVQHDIGVRGRSESRPDPWSCPWKQYDNITICGKMCSHYMCNRSWASETAVVSGWHARMRIWYIYPHDRIRASYYFCALTERIAFVPKETNGFSKQRRIGECLLTSGV